MDTPEGSVTALEPHYVDRPGPDITARQAADRVGTQKTGPPAAGDERDRLPVATTPAVATVEQASQQSETTVTTVGTGDR